MRNRVGYSCTVVLRIPVIDQEGDTVRCRWATGNECASVCNAIPNAILDEVRTSTCIAYLFLFWKSAIAYCTP